MPSSDPPVPAVPAAPWVGRFTPGLAIAALLLKIGLLGAFLFAARGSLPTPATTASDAPIAALSTPTTAICQTFNRSAAELRALAPPPAVVTQTPTIDIRPVPTIVLPGGPAVDDETERQVTGVIRTFAWCAEDVSLSLASRLLTDDYVRRELQPLAANGFTVDEMIAIAQQPNYFSPMVAPDAEPSPILKPLRQLPDGRVAVIVRDIAIDLERVGVILLPGSAGWQIDELGYLQTDLQNEAVKEALWAATPIPSFASHARLFADDMSFGPTRLVLPVGEELVIAVLNVGQSPHNFSIDALGISVEIQPGEMRPVIIDAATKAGTYEFYDAVPGHRANGMVGQLVIGQP